MIWLEYITADKLWFLAKLLCFLAFALWLYRVQRNPANGVNLLEFIQDPKTDKLSGFRLAYFVCLWATTYKFVITPLVTGSDLAMVMGAYGALWVAGSVAAKQIDRPPDPPPPPPPPPPPGPGVVVNNQPGIGP